MKTVIAIVIALAIAVPSMACSTETGCTNTATAIGVGVGIAGARAEGGSVTIGQPILAPEINPIVAPLTQSDKFGTYSNTLDLPLFASPVLTPLSRDERVVRIVKKHHTVKNWSHHPLIDALTSIRYEEIEPELLKLADEFKDYKGNLRYLVKYKMSVQSMGTGGGVAGSDIGASMAGTASIVPYVGSSTVNPKFFLIIYEVQ